MSEEFKVANIVNISRETINCAKCKHCGKQTCVPYGFGCQYEPTITYRSPRLSQGQLNRINEIVKNLQQENKQLKEDLKDWDRIFDTFSKRKYAHRYLEERRKEIPNLLCPDSDEIYQKYYELKERIDKAIEYIKKAIENTRGCGLKPLDEIYAENIIDLLKGEK